MMFESEPFDYVRDWNRGLSATGWWHSFELPDGAIIKGVCDLPGLKNRLGQFSIPADLSGKRVLDIGAWDGWFSFEMERRGAEVVALDCWDNPRFRELHARLNSRVEYRQMDVYDLHPSRVGRFDIVLFMGVLYHLKHPLLALEKVCSVTRGMAAVDSFILKEAYREGAATRPILEFYETDEFGGQTDNWVGPSLPCLLAFCRTAGFARVEHLGTLPHSACIACYRHWEPAAAQAETGPALIDVFHHVNFGINFSTTSDDYITAWFSSSEEHLAIEDVLPEVSGYGVRPIRVSAVEAGKWQAQFKLPPGLDAGWHEVQLRLRNTAPGESRRIAVDMPLETIAVTIDRVEDGHAWSRGRLDLSQGDSLAIWARGLPENADRSNVKVMLEGRRLVVSYVEPGTGDAAALRQINAQVPASAPPGSHKITVEAGARSLPESVEIVR